MKISYLPKWHPTSGTVYRQTIRISPEENRILFREQFAPGINYGNAYTGAHIAAAIHNLPEYSGQLRRIVSANTIVLVAP
ncbi:MAG: hypothetical protein II346_01775 [Ruminococcus sp.]|nr:hypothetical protein [Ruminococcus sp.]